MAYLISAAGLSLPLIFALTSEGVLSFYVSSAAAFGELKPIVIAVGFHERSFHTAFITLWAKRNQLMRRDVLTP